VNDIPASNIHWIMTSEALPPMNKFVLIFRVGGKNNHNDIGLGYRRDRYGTRDEWDWVETGYSQDYWGVSVDGSTIICWADKPHPPKRTGPPGGEDE